MSVTTANPFLDRAEDHFVHGHLLGGWIVDYIDLEESLAVGSLAQEELAHASTFLTLAAMDEAGRDAFVFDRPLEQWHPTQLVAQRLHTWPATVLRGLLLSQAAVVRSTLMASSEDSTVRDAAAVLAAEQHLHVLHWERWVRLLASHERTAAEFAGCAVEVLALGGDVFGVATGSGGVEGQESAHRAWTSRVAASLAATGVDAAALGEVPVARRPATEQPELVEVLSEIRSIRAGADDGVRGLYR